jgi:hypothetical protein
MYANVMHNCTPKGKKNILKSWAVRAGAWTAWELVIAGSWLGYRYLGASWFMSIFEVMQFCVQSRHTSSQKEFSMHKVNKCWIVVSFVYMCVLCSLHLHFVFSCLKQLKCKLGLQPKNLLQQQYSVPNIREEKIIPIKLMLFLLDELYIYIM